jgi:hypothetical protein
MPDERQKPYRSTNQLIGWLAALYLLVVTTAVVVGAGVMMVRASRAPRTAEATVCWKIQEAAGRVFKLNACTGEMVEVLQEKGRTGA